ncbi:MAG: hypothetical protein ACFFCO_12265 [Promethearchaeota archaeon]
MVKIVPTGFVQYNAKLLDINESGAWTCTRTFTLVPNVVAVVISAHRQSGTGSIIFYPNESTQGVTLADGGNMVLNVNGQQLKFKQGTAADDWDIYCMGYWTEGRLEAGI